MSNASISAHYEYMDENEIDAGLKCVICIQPLQAPVSLSNCHHTFCQECIETWLTRSETCPTCRQNPIRSHNRLLLTPPFAPLRNRVVLNQLDRLLVRCLLCREAIMERRYRQNHRKICSKRTMKSPWHGSLLGHLDACALQQVQSLVVGLANELVATHLAFNELKHSVNELESNVHLLLKCVNNEKFMVQQCTKSESQCKYSVANDVDRRNRVLCRVYDQYSRHDQIALRSCSGSCMCDLCVDTQ